MAQRIGPVTCMEFHPTEMLLAVGATGACSASRRRQLRPLPRLCVRELLTECVDIFALCRQSDFDVPPKLQPQVGGKESLGL